MPLLKASIKANRQNIKRNKRNVSIKRKLKATYKTVVESAEKKDLKTAKDGLSVAFSELDKALKKNLLKKNTVARRKARLHRMLKNAGNTGHDIAPLKKVTVAAKKTT